MVQPYFGHELSGNNVEILDFANRTKPSVVQGIKYGSRQPWLKTPTGGSFSQQLAGMAELKSAKDLKSAYA
ncbi:MAG: hypothetical protein ACYC9L_15420 [Sulfuricaulis sp.]